MNRNIDELIVQRLSNCSSLLIKKGKEYSERRQTKSFNRFIIFEIADNLLMQGNKFYTLCNFQAKHLASIIVMLRSNNVYPIDIINEKFSNAINYFILLHAMAIKNPSLDVSIRIFTEYSLREKTQKSIERKYSFTVKRLIEEFTSKYQRFTRFIRTQETNVTTIISLVEDLYTFEWILQEQIKLGA